MNPVALIVPVMVCIVIVWGLINLLDHVLNAFRDLFSEWAILHPLKRAMFSAYCFMLSVFLVVMVGLFTSAIHYTARFFEP